VPIFQEQVMQLAIVAAGFTPGEADQLRRSMAAWQRRGGLEYVEQRLLDGMRERGYSEDFAKQIFRQIQGFASYGFPESHSASFALLVYVSAWLKFHEPAAFAAGLLNSQPMGFYAPAQLVQDAQRHGVEVRAVDVTVSSWDCSLEPDNKGRPALRLGLRMIKGFREDGAIRITEARAEKPFASITDLAFRGRLDKHDLRCLASADALGPLADHRADGRWKVAGFQRMPSLFEGIEVPETSVRFDAPTEGKDVVDDYAAVGLSLRRHPLSLIRQQLLKLQLKTALDLQTTGHGNRVKAAGLVITRQRPETASGVVFLTMEDETGSINVIVHNRLLEKQRSEVLTARLLEVQGELQREGDVIHLIARRLIDRSPLLGKLTTQSRDFH
jgi:error-prone DNA polymerase